MPWPPTIPTATRTNATDQGTLHPNDHNQMAQALTDIVGRVNTREVGYAETTTPQSGIGASVTTLSNLSVPFTAVAGRRYRISFTCTFYQSTSAGNADYWFLNNSAGLWKLSRSQVAGSFNDVSMVRRAGSLSGACNIQVGVSTNGGTVGTSVGGGSIASLIVEDIGGIV